MNRQKQQGVPHVGDAVIAAQGGDHNLVDVGLAERCNRRFIDRDHDLGVGLIDHNGVDITVARDEQCAINQCGAAGMGLEGAGVGAVT